MENKIPIEIDDDHSIGYEKNNWLYIFKLSLIFWLAFWVALKKMIFGANLKTNTFWFDGLSPICREMKENVNKNRADLIFSNIKNQSVHLWLQRIFPQ